MRKNIAIIFVLTFYALTHLQFLSYTQYWDSNLYWHGLIGAVTEFSLTPLNLKALIVSFLSNFNILHQLTMGYMSLMSISQMFGVGNVKALNIENMVLAMIGIWGFYNIVCYIFPKNNQENILITLIFAFNPLFYATSISFNTDFSLLIFTVLMIEAFTNKRRFWFLFWSLMLTLSKITGGLIYVSFIFFYYLIFISKRSVILRWKSIRFQVLFFLLPALAFAIYTIYSHGQVWSTNTDGKFNFNWTDNCVFCLGLTRTNITTRIFQIFIMNFSWIMSLIIFTSTIKNLIIKSKIFSNLSEKKSNFIVVLVLVFTTFVSFNLLVIVMNFPRYIVSGVFFVVLIFYISLNSLISKKRLRQGILIIIFILFFIQTFVAIDPSPRILFGTTYLGRNTSSPVFGHNDGLVYNTQFFFIDGLNKMIIDNTPNDYKSVYDLDTGYFFKNPRFIGSIDNLPQFYNEGYDKLTYIYLPWLSYRNKLYEYVNILYTIKDMKVFNYKGFYAEVFYIESIKK